MDTPRVYRMTFASIYPLYVAKAEKKGRSKDEVDQILCWLTGYTQQGLESEIAQQTDLESFYAKAPRPNPNKSLITGVVCGVRVEDIQDATMKDIRYADKLIDELAKGRPLEKILRTP